MKSVTVDQAEEFEEKGCVRFLLAGGDAGARSLLAALARERVESLKVLEAADGAEAVQVGLLRRPQIALLDVTMPVLGGIQAAITLRELHPQTRIALASGDSLSHQDEAREQCLPLFDKLDLDRALDWLELHAQAFAKRPSSRSLLPRKLSLKCSFCGYGIARAGPPERCPMCQRAGSWVYTTRRRWSRDELSVDRA
jgi:CheY-like chemotaxis protein